MIRRWRQCIHIAKCPHTISCYFFRRTRTNSLVVHGILFRFIRTLKHVPVLINSILSQTYSEFIINIRFWAMCQDPLDEIASRCETPKHLSAYSNDPYSKILIWIFTRYVLEIQIDSDRDRTITTERAFRVYHSIILCYEPIAATWYMEPSTVLLWINGGNIYGLGQCAQDTCGTVCTL